MRRHRGDVLVARFSGPHDRNHGLVTHGHIHGDDHWFSCHGLRQHFLGYGDGSLRAAEGGARRLLSVGGESGAGGVQPLAVRIPSGVWFAGRHWNVRNFCADDGHGDRMVRYSKKSGVSLVSAGMGMAPMTMSPIAAWLILRHDWRTSLLIIAGIAAVT